MTETRSGRAVDSLLERSRRDGARKKPRVAFVLSGGGNLGAIQVGMLKSLVERDIRPDVVLGCSVGAMNGAGFALDPTEDGVANLTEMWDSAVGGDMMPSSRIPSVVQLVRKGVSIYESTNLRAVIERMLGERTTFEELALPFQCNAADVESSMSVWFSHGDLLDPLLASAALPAVYPPVVVDGHTYIDGGVIENVPIGRAVELGCRTIYVLHVGPHGRPDLELKRPLDGALQAYWVARNSQFAKDLSSLPEKVEAIVLPPGQRPELKHDDFSQTESLIAQGYANSSRFLDERSETEGSWFTTDLLRPIERLVLNARSMKWRQDTQKAANAPDGAVVSADDGRSAGLPDLEEIDDEVPATRTRRSQRGPRDSDDGPSAANGVPDQGGSDRPGSTSHDGNQQDADEHDALKDKPAPEVDQPEGLSSGAAEDVKPGKPG